MTTMVAHSRPILHSIASPRREHTLSDGDLLGIARTFDEAEQAVWVHDLSGRCVYRNRLAGQTSGSGPMHEILDHQGRQVGHLRMAPV